MTNMRAKLLSTISAMLMTVTFVYAADDTDPPEISGVEVVNVTDSSVTITWNTDEEADSLVNYGLQEDYGIVRQPVAEREQHSVTLDGLEPGRVYHFRVVSADEEGNQGISADYKVQTTGTPQADGSGAGSNQGDGDNILPGNNSGTLPGSGDGNQVITQDTPNQPNDPQIVQEITKEIQEITDPEVLKEILNETVKAIEGITEDLTIVGPPTVTPETTSALIEWTTDRPSDSVVMFSPSSEYIPDQYVYSQSATDGLVQKHQVQLIGLTPYTEYNFRVESTDDYGITGRSLDYTFRTKASLPNIKNLRIVKVEEDAATLAWDTTVPAKALIEYQDLTTGQQNSKGRPTLASTHQMRIAGLTLGTRYVAFVIAENSGGDRVKSQPITFITQRDTAPPLISNVTNESTLFVGDGSRIQTIVEWRTDEPAYCTMTYTEGVVGGVEPIVIEAEEVSYAERHVEVIVDFAPATVYQFWLNCTDEAENTIQSENFVLFTPIQEKNIIDLILENFESTFGWVKNIGA